jgi:hypothetical protein
MIGPTGDWYNSIDFGLVIVICFENFDILEEVQNYKPLNTKILLIPQFLGHRLVCAQAILLFDKPVSKKCGNCIHFVFQRQFRVSEMGLDDGLRNTLADLFNKYICSINIFNKLSGRSRLAGRSLY